MVALGHWVCAEVSCSIWGLKCNWGVFPYPVSLGVGVGFICHQRRTGNRWEAVGLSTCVTLGSEHLTIQHPHEQGSTEAVSTAQRGSEVQGAGGLPGKPVAEQGFESQSQVSALDCWTIPSARTFIGPVTFRATSFRRHKEPGSASITLHTPAEFSGSRTRVSGLVARWAMHCRLFPGQEFCAD